MFKKIFTVLKNCCVVLFAFFGLNFAEAEVITRDSIINEICKELYKSAPYGSFDDKYRCIGARTQEEKSTIYYANKSNIGKNLAVDVLKKNTGQPFGYTVAGNSLNSSMEAFCDIAIYAVYSSAGLQACKLDSVIQGNRICEFFNKNVADHSEKQDIIHAYLKAHKDSLTAANCNFLNILNYAISLAHGTCSSTDELPIRLPTDDVDAVKQKELASDFKWYTQNWDIEGAIKLIRREACIYDSINSNQLEGVFEMSENILVNWGEQKIKKLENEKDSADADLDEAAKTLAKMTQSKTDLEKQLKNVEQMPLDSRKMSNLEQRLKVAEMKSCASEKACTRAMLKRDEADANIIRIKNDIENFKKLLQIGWNIYNDLNACGDVLIDGFSNVVNVTGEDYDAVKVHSYINDTIINFIPVYRSLLTVFGQLCRCNGHVDILKEMLLDQYPSQPLNNGNHERRRPNNNDMDRAMRARGE